MFDTLSKSYSQSTDSVYLNKINGAKSYGKKQQSLPQTIAEISAYRFMRLTFLKTKKSGNKITGFFNI